MAGDWIKIEKATARKPEVLHLSSLLEVHPDHAFGLCFRFWSWCDDQLTSCHAAGVTFVTLDSVIGHAGFASALVKVGWLQVREGSLVIPHFERHLSDSAKNRALSGKRQQNRRDSVTETSRSERDESVTREEKRREENTNTETQNAAASHVAKRSSSSHRPSIQEVMAYVSQIGASVDAREFVDYYESNGWKVGRNAMKDWQATVRQWESRRRKEGTHNGNGQRTHGHAAQRREQTNADAFATLHAAISQESTTDAV